MGICGVKKSVGDCKVCREECRGCVTGEERRRGGGFRVHTFVNTDLFT